MKINLNFSRNSFMLEAVQLVIIVFCIALLIYLCCAILKERFYIKPEILKIEEKLDKLINEKEFECKNEAHYRIELNKYYMQIEYLRTRCVNIRMGRWKTKRTHKRVQQMLEHLDILTDRIQRHYNLIDKRQHNTLEQLQVYFGSGSTLHFVKENQPWQHWVVYTNFTRFLVYTNKDGDLWAIMPDRNNEMALFNGQGKDSC